MRCWQPGDSSRHGGMRVPSAGGGALHRHAGGSEDDHRGAAEYAELHAGALDVVGFGGEREQCRHARARHAERQRQRQYHCRRLHRGRRLRAEHRAESRRDLRVQDSDLAERRHVRRDGSEHEPDDQARREHASTAICGSSCATTSSMPMRSSAMRPDSRSRT